MAAFWASAPDSLDPTLADDKAAGEGGALGSSQRRLQRPALVRVGRFVVSEVWDLRRGSIMARSWSKPSAEARPAVASSQRAC